MDCVFCKKIETVFENENAVAFFDKFPVSKGHMLIITKCHKETFFFKCKDLVKKHHLNMSQLNKINFLKYLFWIYLISVRNSLMININLMDIILDVTVE